LASVVDREMLSVLPVSSIVIDLSPDSCFAASAFA
jgi:hypothetical protein